MTALETVCKFVLIYAAVSLFLKLTSALLNGSTVWRESMERKYRHESIQDGVLEYRRAAWKAQQVSEKKE